MRALTAFRLQMGVGISSYDEQNNRRFRGHSGAVPDEEHVMPGRGHVRVGWRDDLDLLRAGRCECKGQEALPHVPGVRDRGESDEADVGHVSGVSHRYRERLVVRYALRGGEESR